MQLKVLSLDQWQQRSKAHEQAAKKWTDPFRARRRVGKSHPVHDFLFVYYQYSPAKLEKWHPGVGVRLVGGARFLDCFSQTEYHFLNNDAVCDPSKLTMKASSRLRWIVDLLKETMRRQPNFSCLGLHEWAMVYQGREIKHEKTANFRLEQKEIDELVESRPICCSHFDAFRFFANRAKPLNRLQPTLESRVEFEQPACIHANMDLYKWAFKAMPWIGSDLLLRCFQLALEARAIDMRASPYDLSAFKDFEPIPIELPDGRTQYQRLQREIADKARPLREELIKKIETVLELVCQ